MLHFDISRLWMGDAPLLWFGVMSLALANVQYIRGDKLRAWRHMLFADLFFGFFAIHVDKLPSILIFSGLILSSSLRVIYLEVMAHRERRRVEEEKNNYLWQSSAGPLKYRGYTGYIGIKGYTGTTGPSCDGYTSEYHCPGNNLTSFGPS